MLSSPHRQRLFFHLIALLVATTVLILYILSPSFLEFIDLRGKDFIYTLRPQKVPPEDIVIVAIDEKSINELGRWPWKRTEIAQLVEGLREARVVAFDIVFSEKENDANDSALAAAIKEADNVVLGYFFRDQVAKAPEESLRQIERSAIKKIRLIGTTTVDPLEFVPRYSGVEPNIPVIGSGARGFGSFNIIPDVDGVYRRSHLVFGYRGELYPALSLEALRRYYNTDVVLGVASYGLDSIRIGDKEIPLESDGSLGLNFYGRGGTFRTYSAVDIIKGRVGQEEFAGRLVFVGATELGIYDMRPTPVDAIYPGVEVHATVSADVMEQNFLKDSLSTGLMGAALIVALPFAMAFVLMGIGNRYAGLGIFAALLVLTVVFEVLLFTRHSILLSPLYPLLSLSLGYAGMEAYRNMVVERKSRFYRKAFSTYVPPQVVEEIIREPERLSLGGEKRQITVLFADIRGFTRLAESMEPERLVTLLHEYLTPLTEIVFREKGTLDKYIGDAIMAIFNAPHRLDDHPQRACRVALEMTRTLKELGRSLVKKGYPELRMGIGINTGEAVVGNMGTELRFDYTAIGDTVNLASRLEGMNRVYGTEIITGERTFELAGKEFLLRELDFVKVKGKERPVRIYQLLGTGEESLKEGLVVPFEDALRLYRLSRFSEAKEGFQKILERFPHDGPTLLYVRRCEEFIKSPPPEGWDGVYRVREK